MDEKARKRFEQMYLEYEGTVRRLAYGYNIPVDYIDDIVQDTFVSYAQYDYSLEQTETGQEDTSWPDCEKPLCRLPQKAWKQNL